MSGPANASRRRLKKERLKYNSQQTAPDPVHSSSRSAQFSDSSSAAECCIHECPGTPADTEMRNGNGSEAMGNGDFEGGGGSMHLEVGVLVVGRVGSREASGHGWPSPGRLGFQILALMSRPGSHTNRSHRLQIHSEVGVERSPPRIWAVSARIQQSGHDCRCDYRITSWRGSIVAMRRSAFSILPCA
jgi:hypothetical protein